MDSGDGHNTRPKRLLLLLATKNADKPAAPAGFEHRLAMMGAFAEDLKGCLGKERRGKGLGRKDVELSNREGVRAEGRRKAESSGDGAGLDAKKRIEGNEFKGPEVSKEKAKESKGSEQEEDPDVIIDIGVTKEAMFVEKARVIEESGLYVVPLQEKRQVEQVHLTGYDTLIRLVDPKYYPPELMLAPLKGLFDKHSVRVMMRSPPSIEEQVDFVKGLKDGTREAQGWKREWAERVELVEGRKNGQEGISSTRAREKFKDSTSRERQGDQWCSDSVVGYVLREGLYLDGGTKRVEQEQSPNSSKQ